MFISDCLAILLLGFLVLIGCVDQAIYIVDLNNGDNTTEGNR